MITIDTKRKVCKYSTVINDIKYLREMKDFLIDQKNSNRYRIVVKEPMGHTAYCFSTPIYNVDTRKLVIPKVEKNKNGYSYKGSNALVSVHQNRCVFENREGRCIVFLNESPVIKGEKRNSKSSIIIIPALNGLRFFVKGNNISLQIKSEVKQQGIRFHSTCFSVMSEKFKPFVSVACLYASDGNGTVSPVELKYKDVGNQTYELSFSHDVPTGSFFFEVNLYEPKLFQDTTVESLHPDANNAYGAVGFIGKTKQFGEQWLYSRPDFSKISDLNSQRIEKALLHIPILNGSTENVDVYIPEKRFCSFGSTWNKKINATTKAVTSDNNGKYLTIDVTAMYTNRTEHTLVYNEGLILRKPKGKNNYVTISTGDCYSAPQILEIKFKN